MLCEKRLKMQATGCPYKNGVLDPSKFNKQRNGDVNKDVIMDDLPGPRGPPGIGQFFNLDTDNMHLKFMEWQKTYGDIFMFKIFGQHYLVISDPDILKDMFVTCEHAKALNDRPASFTSKYVIDRSKDILFRKCDDKQQVLKMLSLNYIEKDLLEEKWFYELVLEEFEDLNKTLVDVKDSSIDLASKLDEVASKVIALMLLGRRVKDHDPEITTLRRFMEAGNEIAIVKNQTILTKFPGMRKVPGHLKDIYDAISEEKQNLKEYYIERNENSRGLIAKIKELSESLKQETGDSWIDDEFILGVILDLAAAGLVPLQNILGSLFLVLIHYPHVQEGIRREIRSKTSPVTIDDYDNMPYCAASILELKRYHTPLAISARHCNRSSSVNFGSYNIPRNTQIFTNLFGMLHDERFWTDPWKFKPGRFLTASGELISDQHPNMQNMVVGGVGPRRCVGNKFAEYVTFLAVTSLLRKFHIRPSDTEVLPPCDPRQFVPGVVIRAPDYKCVIRETDQIQRTHVVKEKHESGSQSVSTDIPCDSVS